MVSVLCVAVNSAAAANSYNINEEGTEILDKIEQNITTKGTVELQNKGHAVAQVKEVVDDSSIDILDSNEKIDKALPPPFQDPIPKRQKPIPMKSSTIPDYVIKHAPIVHLYSEERYYPYDIEEYVSHFDLLTSDKQTIQTNIDIQELQHYPDMRSLYITAKDEFINDPEWITGKNSIPDIETGKINNAPATLIVADHGNGYVDAFWFYFYSFNEGPYIMGTGPYGNHIGDWEHSLVRFKNGKPEIVWMSAHGGGSAYKYKAMEKLTTDENRPVIFSARGTHANYASVGQHSHDLPFYILSDFTDRGPIWDPAKNYLAYTFDKNTNEIGVANGSIDGREHRLGNWLSFIGHWGDKRLDVGDPRQKRHPFEWRFIDGPTGPVDKNLNRYKVCQRSKWWNFLHSCRIRGHVDQGEGVEAEGGSCVRIFDSVKPLFLQYILRLLTWRGWGCFFIDRTFG